MLRVFSKMDEPGNWPPDVVSRPVQVVYSLPSVRKADQCIGEILEWIVVLTVVELDVVPRQTGQNATFTDW